MTQFRALFLTMFTLAVCLASGIAVASLSKRASDYAGPIILAGAVLPACVLAPLWVVAIRPNRAGLKARLDASERVVCLANGVAVLGGWLLFFGHGILAIVGLALASVGVCVGVWAFFNAASTRDNPST